MLVACDIGNTNIVLALFDGDRFVDSWRVYTDTRKTSANKTFINLSPFGYLMRAAAK